MATNERLLQSWYNRSVTGRVGDYSEDSDENCYLADSVFEEAEALARQLGVSRSELYTMALQAYLQKYNRHQILNKLNQVYFEESSQLDPMLARMQFMSLPREDWSCIGEKFGGRIHLTR